MGSIDRDLRIREKYELEQNQIKYLLAKGLHLLEIADQLTHVWITMLREWLKLQHPDWNDDEILKDIRKKLDFYRNMHKKRRLRKSGRIN